MADKKDSLLYIAIGYVVCNQHDKTVELSKCIKYLETFQKQMDGAILGQELLEFLENSGFQFTLKWSADGVIGAIEYGVEKVSISSGVEQKAISSAVQQKAISSNATGREGIKWEEEDNEQSTTTKTSENIEASVYVVPEAPEDEKMKRLIGILTASLLNPGDKLLVSMAGLIYQKQFNVALGKSVGMRFNEFCKSQTKKPQFKFNKGEKPGYDYFTNS